MPNILWLVLDSMRVDHAGCYGNPRPLTPTLDQLAATGTRVETAIVQGGYSLPSCATMLTGQYASEHGMLLPSARMSADTLTLPELLRDAGYATATLGANPFIPGGFGLERGFEVNLPLYPGRGRPQVDDSHTLNLATRSRVPEWLRYLGYGDRGAQSINQAIVQFAREHRERNWFVLAHYMETHEPYTPPLGARLACRRAWGYRPLNPLQIRNLGNHDRLAQADAAMWDLAADAAQACVWYVDQQLGRLLAGLKRESLLDDTVVIVCADHGNYLGERGLWGHDALLGETLCHVPLVLWGPGLVPAGAVVSGVAEMRDIPHSLCELTGAGRLPAGARTPVNLLTAPQIPADRVALAERTQGAAERAARQSVVSVGPAACHNRTVTMLRSPEWEYLEYEDGRRELFTPGQLQDQSAAQPEVVARFAAQLLEIRAGLQVSGATHDEEFSPEVAARLEALGYL